LQSLDNGAAAADGLDAPRKRQDVAPVAVGMKEIVEQRRIANRAIELRQPFVYDPHGRILAPPDALPRRIAEQGSERYAPKRARKRSNRSRNSWGSRLRTSAAIDSGTPPPVRLGDRACDACHRVCVAPERYRVAHGSLEIAGIEKADDRLRDRAFSGDVERVRVGGFRRPSAPGRIRCASRFRDGFQPWAPPSAREIPRARLPALP
jgi:hypothetical protein